MGPPTPTGNYEPQSVAYILYQLKTIRHASIFGIHDFSCCYLATPGSKVIVHKNTDNCRSWSPDVMDGWYIGPSMEHYRCVKSSMPATSIFCNMDTHTFFSTVIPFPKMDTEYYLRKSVGDILSILNKSKTQLHFLTYG